jgi:hypothetical protein
MAKLKAAQQESTALVKEDLEGTACAFRGKPLLFA